MKKIEIKETNNGFLVNVQTTQYVFKSTEILTMRPVWNVAAKLLNER